MVRIACYKAKSPKYLIIQMLSQISKYILKWILKSLCDFQTELHTTGCLFKGKHIIISILSTSLLQFKFLSMLF